MENQINLNNEIVNLAKEQQSLIKEMIQTQKIQTEILGTTTRLLRTLISELSESSPVIITSLHARLTVMKDASSDADDVEALERCLKVIASI